MKRVFALFLVLLTAVCFGACNPDDTNDHRKNVSFYQTHCYSGENEGYAVTVTAGKREVLFQADGKVGELKDFVTVMVTPLKTGSFTDGLTFTLLSDSGEQGGSFVQDKFSASVVGDIETGEYIDSVKSVMLSADGDEQEIVLTDRLADMIGWEQALDIATSELADYIAANTGEDGVFNKEISIKYIRNRNDVSSPYYWYVACIGEGFDFVALLIEPSTGEIVVRR